MGLYYDFSKNYLPNLAIPSNCHSLLEFLKMGSNGKVNIDLAYLIKLKKIVDFRSAEIISVLL